MTHRSGMSRSMRLVAVDWPAPSARTSLSPARRACENRGQSAAERDQSGCGDCARAHRADVGAPNLVGRHHRNGNRGGIDRDVAGELSVEADGRHDDEPRDDAACEENAGDARADDVADAEIFGSDGDAERSAVEPFGARFRLRGPRPNAVH